MPPESPKQLLSFEVDVPVDVPFFIVPLAHVLYAFSMESVSQGCGITLLMFRRQNREKH